MVISVFLVDDHEVVRRGISQLLDTEPDITVVGEAATAAQALARVPTPRSDVAILDVRLPDGHGVGVCRRSGRLSSRHRPVRCRPRSPTTKPCPARSWQARRAICSSR